MVSTLIRNGTLSETVFLKITMMWCVRKKQSAVILISPFFEIFVLLSLVALNTFLLMVLLGAPSSFGRAQSSLEPSSFRMIMLPLSFSLLYIIMPLGS